MASNRSIKDLFQPKHYTTWALIKLYWQSEQRFSAYVSVAVVLMLTVALVGVEVALNYWFNYFYDALQAYNKQAAIKLLLVFFIIAGINIVFAVYRFYISQLFGLKWRRWLTAQFVSRWLQKRAYYYLENFDEKTDNPDQRIQEDVNSLIIYSIDLSVGLVGAITTFCAFIYVLYRLSGTLNIPLGSLGVLHIPGYLMWVSVVYAFLGTFITLKIGRPLVLLNFEQQRREANFRFAAMDLRSHAEHVALYRGEQHERTILQGLFGRVLENWYFIIMRQKLLLWFTAGYNQAAVVLPLFVALPNYFGKVFLLGGLIQTIRAFGSVQDSLSFIVNSYTTIAQWQAVGQRLTTFVNHMTDVEAQAEKQDHLVFAKHAAKTINVKNVSVNTPSGELLLKGINEDFIHGSHYLIKGESGIGKSTFVRTLAGIWPYASGKITFPEHQKVMYLPQKTYMPLGTLAEAILFPDKEQPELASQLKDVLHRCHLDGLVPRLNETAAWSEQLSPGEQQRIAFARVLLHKPDWVFLDETTSMLDLANEKNLYKMLKTELPHCSIVSIGHRQSLDDFHDHIINMAERHPAYVHL